MQDNFAGLGINRTYKPVISPSEFPTPNTRPQQSMSDAIVSTVALWHCTDFRLIFVIATVRERRRPPRILGTLRPRIEKMSSRSLVSALCRRSSLQFVLTSSKSNGSTALE